MIDITSKIPTIEFPSIKQYTINNVNEKILSLTEAGFLCESQYYLQGLPGAYKDCYARESVIKHLKKAEQSLPVGYRFKIYDAYRQISVQQSLWDKYRKQVIENTGLTDELEIDKRTAFFVSKPSLDVCNPSLHNTGGSIDLTIIGPDGKELDMGTLFDDFSNKAWTNHFEEYTKNETVRNNRRLLYWTMINAGFTNLPSEWWHYDYGTKFWAYFKNTDALYQGKLTLEGVNAP